MSNTSTVRHYHPADTYGTYDPTPEQLATINYQNQLQRETIKVAMRQYNNVAEEALATSDKIRSPSSFGERNQAIRASNNPAPWASPGRKFGNNESDIPQSHKRWLFWRGGACQWSGGPGVGARCGNGLFPLINLPNFILASLS